jgi:SAM-dependent methyltransferase
MLHEDRRRALSFGEDAELYHRTRPSYPEEMVSDLLGGLGREPTQAEVLDVGCGTGLSAALFRARGARVVGIEPDLRMAAFARDQGFEVEAGPFEAWDPAGRSFDLVVSGQAWHWVDPWAGALKAAEVLKAQGRVGLFWNIAAHPEEVQVAFDGVYARLAPGLEGYSVVLGHGTGDRFDLAAAGLQAAAGFGPVEVRRYSWATTYTKARWLDHLMTHSDHRALPAEQRGRLLEAIAKVIDALGGSFPTGYTTVLVTATRRAETG